MSDAFSNYRALLAKVDLHAAEVTSRHQEQIRCRLGCTACCRCDLTVSRVEADHIATALGASRAREGDRGEAELPPRLTDRAPHDHHPLYDELAGATSCAFLGPGGACSIYAVRPIICRTHGLPIELDDGPHVCPLNFDDTPVEATAAGARLNLATLNQTLALVDRLYVEATGSDSSRVALSDLRDAAEAARSS